MGPVATVHGMVANLNHPELAVEDSAVATVRFSSGALGIVVASNSIRPGLRAEDRECATRRACAVSHSRSVVDVVGSGGGRYGALAGALIGQATELGRAEGKPALMAVEIANRLDIGEVPLGLVGVTLLVHE
jgi:uncharacterized protein YcfJ